MSAPLGAVGTDRTFVGGLVSGIDTAALIDALITIDRRPIDLLENRRTDLTDQRGKFRELNTKLLALRDAARGLDNRSDSLNGDAFEEDIDQVCHRAGELGLAGVPAFMFQEGPNPFAANAFRQIARLTGGAYCPFDEGSAAQLAELLRAVAVFAAGGHKALADYSGGRGAEVKRLAAAMKALPRR